MTNSRASEHTTSTRDTGPSRRSYVGLNAANFFLAEVLGVVLPFLGDFLEARKWRYDAIGLAISLAGLGVFLFQTPAGVIVDRLARRRELLAVASIVVGLSFGILPLVPARPWAIDPLLFLGGAAQSLFLPLLSALALGLVGHERLSRVIGVNQGWNHAGNIAAALLAVALVSWLGVASVFFSILLVSLLAAGSALLIRRDELDERARDDAKQTAPVGLRTLFHDRRVVVLFVATALFHLANAPVMPLVALYIKHQHGSDKLVACVVLVAQMVMVPVALVTGRLCDRLGRKPVFIVGFVALPLRIFLYSLTHEPKLLVALQALDGIGAGIYGVAIVAMTADLTAGKGRFNLLMGLFATAQAVGAVIGPLGSGFIVQHLGFNAAFYLFAAIAAAAATVFIVLMPETRDAPA